MPQLPGRNILFILFRIKRTVIWTPELWSDHIMKSEIKQITSIIIEMINPQIIILKLPLASPFAQGVLLCHLPYNLLNFAWYMNPLPSSTFTYGALCSRDALYS